MVLAPETETPFLDHIEIIAPATRTATIMGETVDLSFISTRVSFKFIEFSKKYDSGKLDKMTEDSFDPQMLEDMMGIIGAICEKSNPVVTKDWLLDNVPLADLMKFIQFVFAGISKLKSEPGGEDGKN